MRMPFLREGFQTFLAVLFLLDICIHALSCYAIGFLDVLILLASKDGLAVSDHFST